MASKEKASAASISKKLERACHEYTIDLNWSGAMARAGYSERTCHSHGSKYFARPDVQSLIAQLSAEQLQRAERDGDDVIARLEAIAYYSVKDVFQSELIEVQGQEPIKTWGVKDLEDIPDDALKAIKEIKVVPPSQYGPGKIEVKFKNDLQALELLGRHYQLFEKNSSQGVEFHMDVNLGDNNGAG